MITGQAIIDGLSVYPKFSIAIFAVIVTFVSTLVQKWLTDQEHLKKLKDRQKEIQAELRKSKDPSLMQELNAEMMQITGTMFKSSMKPMFVTLIPFLLLFSFVRGVYIPLLGTGWIWYYLGYSVLSSMVIRKVLKVA